MKKLLNLLRILLIASILIPLTGCWDQNEIDKRAYVVGIGIDKAKNEGKVKITYLISNPEVASIQQGGSTNEPPHEIITFEASSFISSRDMANSVIAKTITYDILDVIIVSEEVARDKDFIRYIYDATKDREIRRDTKLIVTKENASKFIEKNKPTLETRLHEYFELILANTNNIGLTPSSELNVFFRITEADADLFLAIYATAEQEDNPPARENEDDILAGEIKIQGKTNPTQILGSAVFKEGQMIGTLTGEETRLTQAINKVMQMSRFFSSVPDPFMENTRVAIRVKEKTDPTVNIDVSNPIPKIDVTVPLEVEVLSDHSMVNYAEHKDKRDKLKQVIKERIEEKYKELVKRTQEEFKAQPFGFSLSARRHFLTISQWENYDWFNSYPDAEVNVKVDITLGEFGRQTELPRHDKIRD